VISLSDSQLDIVMNASRDLPPDKRAVFLQRIGGILRRYDNRYIPDDAVVEAAARALRGLRQSAA
jgi:hypothetical protein